MYELYIWGVQYLGLFMNEFLTFPYRLTQAVAKGIGRLLVETWENNVYQDNPYMQMTEEQRQQIQDGDLHE